MGGNLAFGHVSQVMPVTAGRRYRLTAMARTDRLTSLSGPRLRVEALRSCPGLAAADGEELRGSRPWSPLTVEFATPPECAAVRVLVRRPSTTRLDRDLRGRLWLDEVRLTDLGPAA